MRGFHPQCGRIGVRCLCPLCLLVVVTGCGKSTAYWTKQANAADPAVGVGAGHAVQEKTGESTTVVPVLIGALNDKNQYVRRDAARALGGFGADAKEAVVPLIARLRDDEPSVRKAAAASLKQIDPAAAKKAGVP